MTRGQNFERWFSIIGLFALAFAVRAAGVADRPYDARELVSITGWRWDLSHLFNFFRGDDNPPLFYILTWFWSSATNAEWWCRLCSALASSATVVFLFLLVELKVTRLTAAAAAILLALHPLSIWAGQSVIPESTAAMFITLSAAFGAYWIGRHGEKHAAPTALFAILAMATHYYGWLYAVFLIALALSYVVRPGFQRKFALPPAIAVCIAALPWIPMVLMQAAHANNRLAGAPIVESLRRLAHVFLFAPTPDAPASFLGAMSLLPSPEIAQTFMIALAIPVAVLAILGAVRHPFLGLLFAIPIGLAMLIGTKLPVFTVKYAVIFAPALMACVAAGIGELSIRGRLGQIVAAGMAAMIIVLFLVSILDQRLAHRRVLERAASVTEASATCLGSAGVPPPSFRPFASNVGSSQTA
ncbi:glycosyltransferase family 39 protein [bacterium]|nr:glycosyltransferase family 39 protein [bacterium]